MLLVVSVAGLLFESSGAIAKSLPSSSTPGRLEQRFEPPAVRPKPAVEFPAPEPALPPDKAAAIRFTLKDLVLDGGTIYPAAELRPLHQSLLGHEISLLDLYKLRDAISAKYHGDGYVLSRASIPAQRIASGVAHMALVEGYVGTVHFEGPYSGGSGILKDYAERIRASRPLRRAVLERAVMLIDDLPGITVRTALAPATSSDPATDLTVTIEREPVGAYFNLDNRGTAAVGPLQIYAAIDLNDQLGAFDQTTVRGIITPHVDELRYIDISHTEQIGLDGTSWVIGVRRYWSVPGADIRQYDISSTSSTLHTGLSYPLIRSRSEALRLTGGITVRNSWTHANGEPLSTDRVRIASVGASWTDSDFWQGGNFIQGNLSRSFDMLGAIVDDKSRPDTRLTFTKVTLTAQRTQRLPGKFSLLVGADSQFTADKLVSAEQFGVGGQTYGRAFDSSAITGDKGFSVRGELQNTPSIEVPHLKYIQLYLFGDYGRTWTYVDKPNHPYQYIASTGGGLRFGLGDRLSGNVELAAPLSYKITTGEDPGVRAFFSLSARY
ncbi:MAG: ShlB/FhaC/HecB family hemolysin secretion/activation protein [Rhodospirillaceae bacterium]